MNLTDEVSCCIYTQLDRILVGHEARFFFVFCLGGGGGGAGSVFTSFVTYIHYMHL